MEAGVIVEVGSTVGVSSGERPGEEARSLGSIPVLASSGGTWLMEEDLPFSREWEFGSSFLTIVSLCGITQPGVRTLGDKGVVDVLAEGSARGERLSSRLDFGTLFLNKVFREVAGLWWLGNRKGLVTPFFK